MFRFSPRDNRAHLIQWREWGEAAFQEAQAQNKLVGLFLTAFWCGYCQRLDETTLSNDEIAALLNAFFIPVRVEESQRPDVDLRYNQDGWPTIAFLTPQGDHLLSVNYTDPEPFIGLLVRLVNTYKQNRDALLATANGGAGDAAGTFPDGAAPLGPPIVGEIAGMLEGLTDREHGGFGSGHKYLHAEANDFLLYLYEVTGERAYLEHIVFTLNQMRQSRTFDSKDGGFFRYSSRPDWQEPHPEKLLDDQAALLRTHLRAYLLTDDPAMRNAAEGLIEYLEATLFREYAGAYAGCQDYVRPQYQPATRPATGPPPLLSYIDEYVYCDANARLASAYLEAWWLLGLNDCKSRASGVLGFLWDRLRQSGYGMCHYWDGSPQVPGLLPDTVMAALALLDGYAYLEEASHLERAEVLASEVLRNHRNPEGGFADISATGPARLRYPVTSLTQNASLASLLIRLSDLTGNLDYRREAHWALRPFPNSHRQYEAFAAGFGHSLARLLSLPLTVTIAGSPGNPDVRALARAALTGLSHGNVVLRFHEDYRSPAPKALVQLEGRTVSISNPHDLRPEVILGSIG